MRTLLLAAFSLAGLLTSTATLYALPAPVTTDVTIDTITVTANQGLGTWKVVVSGTVTLGTNDTYSGFQVSMTDPNGATVAPFIS